VTQKFCELSAAVAVMAHAAAFDLQAHRGGRGLRPENTLAAFENAIAIGVTTLELDRVADEFIRARGGVPTSQGYKGYPRAICISVDDVVVHGIPDDTAVEDGSLVTVEEIVPELTPVAGGVTLPTWTTTYVAPAPGGTPGSRDVAGPA